MGLYGTLYEKCGESKEDTTTKKDCETKAECESLSIGEMIDLQNSMLESCVRLINSEILDENAEIVTEGANVEATKAFMAAKKEYKEELKACKKSIKAKDYAQAKKHVANMKKSIDKVEKEIKNTDFESVGSAVLGYFATGFLDMVQLLLPSFGYGAGMGATAMGAAAGNKVATVAGGIFSGISYFALIAKSIMVCIKELTQLIKDIKDADTSTTAACNLYRGKLLSVVSDFKKQIDKLNKLIDEKEKADK